MHAFSPAVASFPAGFSDLHHGRPLTAESCTKQGQLGVGQETVGVLAHPFTLRVVMSKKHCNIPDILVMSVNLNNGKNKGDQN